MQPQVFRIVVDLVADFVQRGLPGPGFPNLFDPLAVFIDDIPGIVPAEPVEPGDDLAPEPGAFDRRLHVLGVIGFLRIAVLHDVQHAGDPAFSPRIDQVGVQVVTGAVAVFAFEMLGPYLLNLAAFHVTGRGIAVVFEHLQAALGQGKVEAAGDHLVAPVVP